MVAGRAFRLSALRHGWPPREAGWSLLSSAVLLGTGFAYGEGRLSGLMAGPLAVFGLCLLITPWRRQAQAERLAADLCGQSGPPQPLIVSLRRLSEQMDDVRHRLTNTHPVTGFPTREHLCEQMQSDIASGPNPHLLGALRLTDYARLAAFDQIAANSALKAFAQRLKTAARPVHVLGQIDRDCFGVWYRGAGDPEAWAAEFRSLVYVASQELICPEVTLTPKLASGSVRFPKDGGDAAELLTRATGAMARPQTKTADLEGDCSETAREQFALEQDLTRAIAEEQLTMVFQPVVDLAQGRIIGAEALLRWDHPKHGSVSPARFFPIVEALGMSERYGLWVLDAACKEARLWRRDGLPEMKVAVNVSAHQLLDPGLRSKIERTLERHRLPPKALELELTETAAMADAGRTLHLFGELRALGISLAIDDFGSGYSSLSYLKNLPFDKLKIDREFVTGIDDRRDSRAICKALIELGRGLDLLVLAEGVENAGEVSALCDLGCTVFQGFHYSRPLSGPDFRRLASDRDWRARLKPPAAVAASGLLDHSFA